MLENGSGPKQAEQISVVNGQELYGDASCKLQLGRACRQCSCQRSRYAPPHYWDKGPAAGQQKASRGQQGGHGTRRESWGEGVRASGVQYMKRLRNLTSGRGILPGVARLLVADS